MNRRNFMSTLPHFPQDLLSLAYRSSNGELAWPRAALEEALQILAASGYAVLGVEVWLLRGNGSWTGIIPQAKGGPPGVYSWAFQKSLRRGAETWSEFCHRAANHALIVIHTSNVLEDVTPDLRERIRYNLSYLSREEYEQQS